MPTTQPVLVLRAPKYCLLLGWDLNYGLLNNAFYTQPVLFGHLHTTSYSASTRTIGAPENRLLLIPPPPTVLLPMQPTPQLTNGRYLDYRCCCIEVSWFVPPFLESVQLLDTDWFKTIPLFLDTLTKYPYSQCPCNNYSCINLNEAYVIHSDCNE